MVASGRPRYFCAKKSLCTLRVCRSYERGGKYLECPQHLSKRRKEGKKRVSHIDGGEWAAITETASFGVVLVLRAISARGRCEIAFISNISCAALFIEKWAPPPPSSFSHERRAAPQWMDELALLPLLSRMREKAAACDQCDHRGLRARAPFRVQFISHCDSTASDALSYSAWLFRNSGKGCIHSPRLPTSPLPRRLPHGAVVAPLYTHSLALTTNFTIVTTRRTHSC